MRYLVFIVLFFVACSEQQAPQGITGADTTGADTAGTETMAKTDVEEVVSERLAEIMLYKTELDSMVENRRIFVQNFVDVKSQDKLVEVVGDEWPEETTIEVIYGMAYRANKSTQFVSERIHNLKDRRVQFTHYFDDNNRTIAFEKYVMYFENDCDSGSAVETDIKYYTDGFSVEKMSYSLINEEEKELDRTQCIPGQIQDFTVYSSYEELAKAKGLKIMALSDETP